MVWIPGTDYPSAQQHVGYPFSVRVDGTDTVISADHAARRWSSAPASRDCRPRREPSAPRPVNGPTL